MRRPLVFFGSATFMASLVACSALLGDFTVGESGPGGGDAPGEGNIPTGDSASDAPPTDARVDAPPPPPVFKCALNGSPVQLGTAATDVGDQLRLRAVSPNGKSSRRVMWVPNPMSNDVGFATIDESLTAASILIQSFDMTAPVQSMVSFDGGFLALGLSQKNFPHIAALRFDDKDVNPQTALTLTQAGDMPVATSDFSVAAAQIGNGDEFFVVYTLQTMQNRWSMYASHMRIGVGAPIGTFKLVNDVITARPSLESGNLLIDRADGRAILLMGPDQGNGPSTIVQMDLASGGQVSPPTPIQPIHGTSTFQPLAAQTSFGATPNMDKAAFAFLEYDFMAPGQPLYGYAAVLPAPGITAFKPTQLPPPITFATASDVAVDKGNATWSHFPGAGGHIVEAARATQTGKGVNFVWLDGNGNLRGKASGADALAQGDLVKGATGIMTDPPNAIIANAMVAWVTDGGALRIGRVGCAK